MGRGGGKTEENERKWMGKKDRWWVAEYDGRGHGIRFPPVHPKE